MVKNLIDDFARFEKRDLKEEYSLLDVRERFLRTMRFEKVDRPPLCEFLGYWPETIKHNVSR
jgi:hypothetical protein